MFGSFEGKEGEDEGRERKGRMKEAEGRVVILFLFGKEGRKKEEDNLHFFLIKEKKRKEEKNYVCKITNIPLIIEKSKSICKEKVEMMKQKLYIYFCHPLYLPLFGV